MSKYYARMLDAETGGEGLYQFEGAEDLMHRTADEIVSVFFEHVEDTVLKQHADWELNGVMKNGDRDVVVAMGSLIPQRNEPPLPFVLVVSNRSHNQT